METSKAAGRRRVAGGLLAIAALLGIGILGLDKILWESVGGSHAYALIGFVLIDLVVAAFLFLRGSKTAFTAAAVWSTLRIVLQFADVLSAPALGMSYFDFANYLFNPTLVTAPNPPGVPAALIDLIIIVQLIVTGTSLDARSPAK